MNIEDIIKNNKEKFIANMSDGHQARFAMKLQAQVNRKNKIRRIAYSMVSAVAAVFLVVLLIRNVDNIQHSIYNTDNQKVVELRKLYDKQIEETVMLLESVMSNLDDSTRYEINKVIDNLNNVSEVFADIAPLPEEKQLAITSKIYDNQLETLNILYKKINKKEE